MTTDERIRESAKLAWKNTITAYEDSDEIPFWEGYYTGAKSERNKVLDEAIETIYGVKTDLVDKEYLLKYLNSLKV